MTSYNLRCIIRQMRISFLVLVVLIIGLDSPLIAAPANFTMWLKAHPQAIVADGRSQTTITAEVRDPNGRTVPDGTIVEFTSSTGSIDRTARTAAGIARARLQSSLTVGTAMISAVVINGNAVGQIQVDFLAPGTEMFDESFITITSKTHLGCDVEGRIVDSAGGVTIVHRGLTITAEEAQIDLRTNILRARGKMGAENIVLQRGDVRIEASRLYYDFTTMRGVLLTPAEDGAKRMTFRGRDMFCEPATDDVDLKRNLDYSPVGEASTFIKAASIFIRPGEEVKFKKATFYMDGTKIVSIPMHVIQLRSGAGAPSQMLTYGTSGLRLDLPFYYSLTPSSTGAFRLRHSEVGSWGSYSAQPGWQLDLEQDYNSGGSTDGTFLLRRITSAKDWGARWTQRKEFNNDSQLYTYVDFPSHKNLFGTMNFSRTLPQYTLSVNGRASKLTSGSSLATDAYVQSRSRSAMGGAFNYSIISRISADSSMQDRFGGGLGLQVYGKPIAMSKLGTLNTSLISGQNWGSYKGSSLIADAALYRSLGGSSSMGLGYTYSWGTTGEGYSRHRLSANINLNPSEKWNLYAYATKEITDNNLSAFGSLQYTFAPTWSFGVLGTYQEFEDYSYPEAEYAISKLIGKQDVSLIWSSSRKRFRLEFSTFRF